MQLFNAVAIQQKTIQMKLKESEYSEFKKDDVLKGTKQVFENAMKKSKLIGTDNDTEDIEIKEEDPEIKSEDEEEMKKMKRKSKVKSVKSKASSKKPAWVALQDNYMMDATLKDWDRDSD